MHPILQRLNNGCILDHDRANVLWHRDEDGRAVWLCGRCQLPIGPVLPDEKAPEPTHTLRLA